MIKQYMHTEQLLYSQHWAKVYNAQKVVSELLAYTTVKKQTCILIVLCLGAGNGKSKHCA